MYKQIVFTLAFFVKLVFTTIFIVEVILILILILKEKMIREIFLVDFRELLAETHAVQIVFEPNISKQVRIQGEGALVPPPPGTLREWPLFG